MRLTLPVALFIGLPSAFPQDKSTPRDYRQSILRARQEEAKELTAPDSWLSLVALQPLTTGNVSVGSAPGNTLRLIHGVPHAFTLHVAGDKVTLVDVDPSVILNGTHPKAGDVLPATEGKNSTLSWDDLYAYVIQRAGNQTYLRVGDRHSPDLVHFHGLNFYPIDRAYRITAKWTPYRKQHELHITTVLGTTVTDSSPGYVEFVLDGQIIRLDAMGDEKYLLLSFRDGTSRTSTYGAGRHVELEQPSNGLKSAGTVVIDFNTATNWPCAYTSYGTCPLPPVQNRFKARIPAGEKRYHN